MKSGRYILNAVEGTTGPQSKSLFEDEEKPRMCRGSRCLVLMTVCLGLICALLLIFIVVLLITITAERDLVKSYKNTVEEFNQTINRLQNNYTDLMTEKDQLNNNNINSLNQKQPELETRVNGLTAEKNQMQNNFNSLNQKKPELEPKGKDLTTEKRQMEARFKDLTAEKNQMEARVKELTAEKNQLQNNLTSLSQKTLELETTVNDLTAEKTQLQNNLSSLSQKTLELESKLRQDPVCWFNSNESKSWTESRQFCRDRGADLVIIKTEEKQRFITSFIKERVWIGLTEIENQGNMKWVDNSPLNKSFWYEDPNNADGDEDCVEMLPLGNMQNWNDLPCSQKRIGICEK